ncbi:MAG: hypothetical protein M5T61_08190 [Acidimicrobiia bacterium]|nr:hypothetical protein [Acidimicrobiia bacterium]
MTLFDTPETADPGRGAGAGAGGRDGAAYRLVVAYDGTDFRGFAAQTPEVRTVGGVLGEAIAQVVQRDVDLVCAGRTDAGVRVGTGRLVQG